MEAVRRRYESFARRGIVLSVDRLEDFCKRKKISYERETLRRLRHRWKFTALFSGKGGKRSGDGKPHYMSATVYRYGTVMIDLASMKPERRYRLANEMCGAFLLGKECLSGQLAVVPCRDKTSRSWEDAVEKMCEGKFNAVANFLSDRDAVATSASFRAGLREKFGIGWTFLPSRSKAFKVRVVGGKKVLSDIGYLLHFFCRPRGPSALCELDFPSLWRRPPKRRPSGANLPT